jgi:hypothetical protein
MAFNWMDEMDPFYKECRDVLLAVFCCLAIGIPMVLMRHKLTLQKVQGKMD